MFEECADFIDRYKISKLKLPTRVQLLFALENFERVGQILELSKQGILDLGLSEKDFQLLIKELKHIGVEYFEDNWNYNIGLIESMM